MSPLQTFHEVLKQLEQKPLAFHSIVVQQRLKKQAREAVETLKGALEQKAMYDSLAFQQLESMEATLKPTLNEVKFLNELAGLLDIYMASQDMKESVRKMLESISETLTKAKKRILEYHTALENMIEKRVEMEESAVKVADDELMQNVGVFYVLEYTVQVQYEFTRINDADKEALLRKGLQVEAGNLPAYDIFLDPARQELCYEVLDDDFRYDLLKIYFDFEEAYATGDLQKIFEGLKAFNLGLLRLFQGRGMERYVAKIYAPFGNDVPIEEAITHCEQYRYQSS